MMFGNQLALGSPVRPWTKIELYSLRTTVCACVVPVNGALKSVSSLPSALSYMRQLCHYLLSVVMNIVPSQNWHFLVDSGKSFQLIRILPEVTFLSPVYVTYEKL